ncbi:conserved hypothetical protein [Desulfosarcina cetonica]|uniref:lactate utilization protein n=1 Tax=Desulfosarcina cetonica TaxID=90730 RepID=UPI0006D229D2|nr:lactate utilization protein [Desulfosarcina cetonica]VTR70048.1 conserved hypothetical protein [Desulfosarcina cetonica]
MMDDQAYEQWLWEMTAQRCVQNLVKHGFDAHFLPDVASAAAAILKMVQSFDSFGFGGSSTTRRLGVLEALRAQGKTIHDHWQADLSKAADLDIRLAQGRCDCFFCSANAIAATGEIVNVDGIGNRTNAMTFGVGKVVIVAGMNKVTPDLDSALQRVRLVAAPMRAKSLNAKTPCAETGVCTDCNAPQRICRITTILHRKPLMTDISVFLIGQSLGF